MLYVGIGMAFTTENHCYMTHKLGSMTSILDSLDTALSITEFILTTSNFETRDISKIRKLIS